MSKHKHDLCLILTRKANHQTIVVQNRQELLTIMQLFDSIFPDALKLTDTDDDGDVYYLRWVGERVEVMFCFNEVFC